MTEEEIKSIKRLLELTEDLYSFAVYSGWSGDGPIGEVDDTIKAVRTIIEINFQLK